MFRVNFGNGQVSNTLTSLAAAREVLAVQQAYAAYAFIQRYVGDGEWTRVRNQRGAK